MKPYDFISKYGILITLILILSLVGCLFISDYELQRILLLPLIASTFIWGIVLHAFSRGYFKK